MGIINDVLDISKIETGKLDIINESFLFEPFIEQIVELFSVAAKEKRIRFIYNPETLTPYSLVSDVTRLRQVLSNLLSNAIKFTPKYGEVIFNIKVLETFDDKASIKFSIKDSGIGITKEQQEVIFKPFSQADDGISRKYGGTGLGLTISSDIIKLMNSEIKVESELNKGSEFSFILELEVDNLKNKSKSLNKDLKILVYCKDDDKLKENIKNHINRFGYISEYTHDNNKGDILFCCGIDKLNLVTEEFKKENSKSLIIYVGDNIDILNDKTKSFIDHYLDLPIYGSKIYNIIAEHTDINTNIIKKSSTIRKFDAKVLVAEDNINNQKLIEILLLKLGIKSKIASNGEETVEYYKNEKYDLILMDINMPIMDGITATKIIKDLQEDNYSIPIIALTANSIAGDKERYLAQGMDDYLSKPIEFDKLVSILEKYLVSQNDEIDLIKEVKQENENIQNVDRRNISLGEVKYFYDKHKIMNSFGLDEATVDMLLESFFSTLDGDIKNIQDAIDTKNAKEIASSSHYLKGACANLAMNPAFEILQEINLKAKNGETDFDLSLLKNYFEQIKIN